MKEQAPQRDSRRNINERIASQVRALRAEAALSLDALATKSGVSRSMLSLVERGESSPTAVILEKIAAGLSVPLGRLFDNPMAPVHPISRAVERTPWRDPASGYVRCNISPPNFPSPIQIVDVALPAGAEVAYESGARDVTIHQQIWVLKGKLELTVGRVTHRLLMGDCLAMQLNEPTTFRNRSRQVTRYVVVVTSGHPRKSQR